MSHLREVTLVKGPVLSVYDYITDLKTLSDQMAGKVEVELFSESASVLQKGHDFHFFMTRFGLSQEVHIQVEEASQGHRLRYRQTQGLFLSWNHRIDFEAHDATYTRVTDIIDYQIPFGLLGHILDDLLIRRDIQDILKARSQWIRSVFEAPVRSQPALEEAVST